MAEKSVNSGLRSYLRNLKEKKNIKDYYLKKIKDGKSYSAVLLDGLLSKLLVTFLLFICFFLKTGHFIVSLITCSIFFLFSSYVSHRIKSIRFDKKVNQINEDIVKNKIIKEIDSFTNYEFIKYIKEILEKYYEIHFIEYETDIDLVGKTQNEILAINCLKALPEERIIEKDIIDFKNEMNKFGVQKGMIVTNSYFTDKLKDKYEDTIQFIDFDSLIFMIKEIGDYPSKEEIQEVILHKYKENIREISKRRKNIISKERIFKYLFLSFCLYVLSQITTYSMYYKIISFISLALGIISIFYGLFNKFVNFYLHR